MSLCLVYMSIVQVIYSPQIVTGHCMHALSKTPKRLLMRCHVLFLTLLYVAAVKVASVVSARGSLLALIKTGLDKSSRVCFANNVSSHYDSVNKSV